MTNTTDTKTLVTPEIAESIRLDFTRMIDFWVEEFDKSKDLDDMALERLGVKASELETAGLSSHSKDTEKTELVRETLEYLLGTFNRSLELGELYLDDELEFYARHICYRQEMAPEYPGIIAGYEVAQEILKAYL